MITFWLLLLLLLLLPSCIFALFWFHLPLLINKSLPHFQRRRGVVGTFSHNSLNTFFLRRKHGWEYLEQTHPRSLVIVSLEGEKKTTQLINASNQAPAVLPLLPAPSPPSPSFLTSSSTSRPAFSPSHLFPSVFGSQIFIWREKCRPGRRVRVCKLDIKFMQTCIRSCWRLYL